MWLFGSVNLTLSPYLRLFTHSGLAKYLEMIVPKEQAMVLFYLL